MSEFKVIPKSSSATDEVLAYNIIVSANSEQSYTVTFKYDTNSGYDLSNDDGKMFSGSIQISEGTEPPTMYEQLLADKTERSVTTRPGGFSSVYTDDNTKTLYTSTENGTQVYYFAGNSLDNWVKFGKYKTDLIVYRRYNSSNSSYFKDYQTLEVCKSASSYNASCTLYKYASAGEDIYWRIIRTNADGSIRMLYHGTRPTATNAYISTSLFNSLSDNSKYVGYMYDSNGTNSIIKNTIDTWYQNNLTNYTKFLSTTAIYCNDRSGDGSHFGAYQRLITNKMPTYDCKYINDNFTVDSSKGNGKLTYPIALMTADEVSFAGGVYDKNAHAYYYINSLSTSTSSTGRMEWWTMSPSFWGGSPSSVFHVFSYLYPGMLRFYYVDNAYAVRPVISLKSCV